MQKSLFFKNSFSPYLIPILLLVGSFLIYSYNLEGQPIKGDEIVYLSWGGPNFDIIKDGDFNNPCLKGLEECELLYDPDWRGHYINYNPIRNFFVGFGYYLTIGDTKGDFYEWSCVWFTYKGSCWDPAFEPTLEQYSGGRLFSSIFGSLAIVLAFFIGKILFNRTTGLFFSLILLFYGLWFVNSRLIMTEVYLHFFILLSIFLLLKSFKKENNYRIPYFIFGAISFGIALNIKLVAIELVIPILVMILFYDSFNEKLNFGFFKKKKNVVKAVSLVLVFFVVTSIAFVAVYPRYYDDTFNKILNLNNQAKIGYTSLPTVDKNYLFNTLSAVQVTLVPYIMDSYIHDIFSDESKRSKLYESYSTEAARALSRIEAKSPPLLIEPPYNYSSIPITLFFFVGLIYIIRNIVTRNLKFSEFALLVWFSGLFVFTVLTVDYPWIERYYLPVMFPVILITSYGLGRFIQQIHNQKEKILFFGAFITAQVFYIIPFMEEIYYSNYTRSLSPWNTQGIPVHSQLALNEPLVYVSSITFVMIFVLICLRIYQKFLLKRDKLGYDLSYD